MLIQPYQADELTFAWCYRVYYRWRTHRRKHNSALPKLTAETLGGLIHPYGIHLLELATDPIDMRALVSLAPHESVSVAAIDRRMSWIEGILRCLWFMGREGVLRRLGIVGGQWIDRRVWRRRVSWIGFAGASGFDGCRRRGGVRRTMVAGAGVAGAF